MSKQKSVEAVEAKRTLSTEQAELRSAIYMNAIEQTKDNVRRDTALLAYIVANVQLLRELQHPLAFKMMDDLAFNLKGKSAFAQACNFVGYEVPPAVEVATRAKRKPLTASEQAILDGEAEQARIDAAKGANAA